MFLPYNTEGMSNHREPRCKINEGIGKGATPDIDHRVFLAIYVVGYVQNGSNEERCEAEGL